MLSKEHHCPLLRAWYWPLRRTCPHNSCLLQSHSPCLLLICRLPWVSSIVKTLFQCLLWSRISLASRCLVPSWFLTHQDWTGVRLLPLLQAYSFDHLLFQSLQKGHHLLTGQNLRSLHCSTVSCFEQQRARPGPLACSRTSATKQLPQPWPWFLSCEVLTMTWCDSRETFCPPLDAVVQLLAS